MYSTVCAHGDLRALVANYAVPFPRLELRHTCATGKAVGAKWLMRTDCVPRRINWLRIVWEVYAQGHITTMLWLSQILPNSKVKNFLWQISSEFPDIQTLRYVRRIHGALVVEDNVNQWIAQYMLRPAHITWILNVAVDPQTIVDRMLGFGDGHINQINMHTTCMVILRWCEQHSERARFSDYQYLICRLLLENFEVARWTFDHTKRMGIVLDQCHRVPDNFVFSVSLPELKWVHMNIGINPAILRRIAMHNEMGQVVRKWATNAAMV